MKFVEKCRFLKLELGKSKNNKEYGILTLLDFDNNSHRLFVFDDLKNRFVGAGFKEFEQFEVGFEVYKDDKTYNLRILDFKRLENNGK
jgi:hypothetical protein